MCLRENNKHTVSYRLVFISISTCVPNQFAKACQVSVQRRNHNDLLQNTRLERQEAIEVWSHPAKKFIWSRSHPPGSLVEGKGPFGSRELLLEV